MRNYNEEFLVWLERVREIDPKSHEDLPEELQNEFEKLMFLASIPFCHIYGEDPEALSEFLMICLSEKEYYGEDGAPLQVRMVEEGKTFTSPVTHRVAQPVLYAEDDRDRRFVFLYCDWRGPHLGEAAVIFDAIHEPYHQRGVPDEDLPDVYFIFLTDYDLGHCGQKVIRLEEEIGLPRDPASYSDEEWIAMGCDPNQPDPAFTKWHTIFFNAAMVL